MDRAGAGSRERRLLIVSAKGSMGGSEKLGSVGWFGTPASCDRSLSGEALPWPIGPISYPSDGGAER